MECIKIHAIGLDSVAQFGFVPIITSGKTAIKTGLMPFGVIRAALPERGGAAAAGVFRLARSAATRYDPRHP